MNSRLQQQYEFGPFRLDTSEHCLRRNGQIVPLEPKVFNLLRVLVENDGRLLQKDELIKEVWPDSFVEEGNLNRNIAILRKALGDEPTGKPYIETVPKRGYRFVADVKEIAGNGSRTTAAEPVDQESHPKDLALLPAGAKSDPGLRKSLSARRWRSGWTGGCHPRDPALRLNPKAYNGCHEA